MAKLLDVPYFSQRDNELNPSGSCNVTCVAMCLYFHGIRGDQSRAQLEDQMYVRCINNGWDRHLPEDLKKLAESYPGISNDLTRSGSLQDIRAAIDQGFPCIIHGWFTGAGHIIVIRGYQDDGSFIVNDPNGEWYPTGYDRTASGEKLVYSNRAIAALGGFSPRAKALFNYSQFTDADCEAVNTLWLHRIKSAATVASPAPATHSANPIRGTGIWAGKYQNVKSVVDTLDATRKQNWQDYGLILLSACDDEGITHHRQVAYVLATSSHESLFAPIREAYYLPGGFDSDEAWRRQNLWYYPYYGRGFVQLTHKGNYEWAQSAVNAKYGVSEDFVNQPDRVMEPHYAAYIMVKGMMEGRFNAKGLGLPHYINAQQTDYFHARETVNLWDKAATIQRYAEVYENVLA